MTVFISILKAFFFAFLEHFPIVVAFRWKRERIKVLDAHDQIDGRNGGTSITLNI